MAVREAMLRRLSRAPAVADRPAGVSSWAHRDPWELLAVFPDLADRIRGASVLDFGCGEGHQVLAALERKARVVMGVEIQPELRAVALGHLESRGISAMRAAIMERVPEHARFDVILSQDSMEHFTDADALVAAWRSHLAPDGRIYVTFGPPWYAPYGAHMHFFTPIPWVHLLCPESVVMRVRARYRSDGATRYEDVPGGLGRMSVARFYRAVRRAGLRVVWAQHDTVKGLPIARVPLLRELLTNNVAAVLAHATDRA